MSPPPPTRAVLHACAVLSVVLLGGCGGSDGTDASRQSVDDVVAAVSGLSGQARTDKLVELARAEGGKLTVYSSSSIEQMDQLAGAFEDAYDIDVSLYKAGTDALVQRMVEEKRAGFRGSDVAEANAPGLINLDAEGILAPYTSPAASALAAGAAGKSWTGDKLNTFVVAWNTDRVTKGHEPKSFADLASPEWKGRLVLEADDSDWYKTMWQHLVATGATAADADRLFAAIAANATFVNGHILMTELTAAGEFDVTLNAYLHTVAGLIKKGAPLAWQPAVEPLISRPDGIAVVKGSNHTAAAMLFVDFTLGEGQQIFADAELTPARKDLGVSQSIEQVPMDVPDYMAHADEWAKRYEDLVRLGTVRPGNG